jgi:Cytochrome C oxidase, cbb3-type, subunit III
LHRNLWVVVVAGLVSGLLLMSGCRQDMHDQPRYEPLEASSFFADGRAARPLVPDTVARGQLRTDSHFYAGKVDNTLVDTLPVPLTRVLLERGRQRYDIYCAPCHDRTGGGQGMIVRRGFRRPPSLHMERLQEAPVGHFFDVMSNGIGVMMDYAAQVSPRDRWAIAAYIRVLQLSQHASLADVPPEIRQQLQSTHQ